MTRLLRWHARTTTGHPVATLIVLAGVTVGLGVLATQVRLVADVEAFAPDDEVTRALDLVQTEFGAGAPTVVVALDAGAGGDVISPRGVAAARRVADAARSAARDRLAERDPVVSFATVVDAAAAVAGIEDPGPGEIDLLTAEALRSDRGRSARQLFSDDLDLGEATARAGLVVVTLSPELREGDEARDAAVDIQEAVRQLDAPMETFTFSPLLLGVAADDVAARELPRLLGLSMAVIVVVLALVLRRASDVVLAVAGLGISVVWLYGIGVLLGPDHLGVVGPFTQMTTVVPVLVVALGVDDAVHLLTREREREGRPPRRPASAASLVAVGPALALTSVTTSAGFLANLVSPLSPIADFGVYTAVGVLAALVVTTTLIPAARTLLERRGDPSPSPSPGAITAAMAAVARPSVRHPVPVLALAALVTAIASVGATRVSTTFSEDQFIPDGAEIARSLQRFEDLFGTVTDRTYVLVRGPLATIDAVRGLQAVEDRLRQLDVVEALAPGAAQAASPASLVAVAAARADGRTAERLRRHGWTGSRFADDADVAALYDLARDVVPREADAVLRADDRTGLITISTAGRAGVADLVHDRVRAAAAPLEEAGLSTTVTGREVLQAVTLDALRASQLRAVAVTIAAVAVLLVLYHWAASRRPLLGLITMLPTVLVVVWIVGAMWLVGLSFNVLSITIVSLSIAIGVDYGIHLTQRFVDERATANDDEALHRAIVRTGGALVASAATTAGGFAVLATSSLGPTRQFGLITAMLIALSVVAATIVQPAALAWWSRRT